MDPDTRTGGTRRAFPSTRWSQILAAADPESPRRREDLEELLAAYWKPVYAYIRACGRKIEDAKDLTQSFFAKLLERDSFSRLRPGEGTFRGYLKRAVKNFLIHEARLEEVRQRRRPVVSMDAVPEEFERGIAAAQDPPDRVYDREWFRSVFERAVQELRDELGAHGKSVYFDVFRRYCLGDSVPPTYGEIAGAMDLSETDVRNYLAYCRRLLRERVSGLVRDYVESDADVERELRDAAGL